MQHDRLKQLAFPQAVFELGANAADLIQKEIRLAREEISSNLAIKARATAWILAAGLLALFAALLIVQALVMGIASYGVAVHWACLIVAAVLLLLAALFFLKGRAGIATEILPARTMHQIKRAISDIKEHLT
jgi:uncharacterized membrane protein YqjE